MRKSLLSRLDRHFTAVSALAAAAAAGGVVSRADAAIVYSGTVNLNIPTTIAGVYLNVATGVSNPDPASVPGWDINFYGTSGLIGWQQTPGTPSPVWVSAGGNLMNLAGGTMIDGASSFASVSPGASATLPAGNPSVLSGNNIYGFRFNNENTGQVHYGWIKVSVSGTFAAQPRTIVEYAYEDQPGVGIVAGDVGSTNGSCCFGDGTCQSPMTGSACVTAGGFFSSAADCPSANCPQAAACCKPDGTCASLTQGACANAGGTWGGLGSTCGTAVCTGACCNPDGTCSSGSTPVNCTGAGGTYLGNASTCSGASCFGACCFPDGSCARVSSNDCLAGAGTFAGIATLCGVIACPGGACCLTDGTCTHAASSAACTGLGGAYAGDGTSCRANGCVGNPPLTGACCLQDTTCVEQDRATCFAAGGFYRGHGVLCTAVDCAATGACCALDGSCSPQTLRDCRVAGGWYGGDAVQCGSGVCPTVYTYTGNPVLVADGVCTAQNTFADIVVPDNLTISSADASIVMTHTFQLDLRFTLVHLDSGRSAVLAHRQGSSTDNFGDPASLTPFRFIDQGGYLFRGTPLGPYGTFPASPTGDWLPDQTMAVFNGVPSAGTWRLYVQDCAGVDTGSLVLFKLALKGTGGGGCYANCDGSTAAPVLNVADFTCFLTKFASGNPGNVADPANCDGSTTVPVLNVADFTCFLTKFAGGCP